MSLDQQMKMRLRLKGGGWEGWPAHFMAWISPRQCRPGKVRDDLKPEMTNFIKNGNFVNINTSIDVFQHSSVISLSLQHTQKNTHFRVQYLFNL